MIIGIDGSNLRSGGAITHLSELLQVADPDQNNFSKVILWGETALLNKIEDRVWLTKIHEPLLDKNLLQRLKWQKFYSSDLARKAKCNVLFIPSGIVIGDFRPVVTMSHNMLPFDWIEIKRYGLSWQMVRNLLLRVIQSNSYRAADGMIFLTKFSQNKILKVIKKTLEYTAIINHGINKGFFLPVKKQYPIESFSNEKPFRILYVSTVDMYKHQWNAARAVAILKQKGFPVALHMVGTAYGPALKKLNDVISKVDPDNTFIHYGGPVPYQQLPELHAEADLCLFASSCENMPNILLEAMASGLPIACSNKGPMPEILGEAGIYFDPEKPDDIARALRDLISSPELRFDLAQASQTRSKQFSWEQCCGETFKFLINIANKYNLRGTI